MPARVGVKMIAFEMILGQSGAGALHLSRHLLFTDGFALWPIFEASKSRGRKQCAPCISIGKSDDPERLSIFNTMKSGDTALGHRDATPPSHTCRNIRELLNIAVPTPCDVIVRHQCVDSRKSGDIDLAAATVLRELCAVEMTAEARNSAE